MLVDGISFHHLRINKQKKLAIKRGDIRVGSRETISATGLLSLFTGGASVPFDPPPASSRERVPRRATGPSISRRRPTVAVAVAVGGGAGGGDGGGGSWRRERSRNTDI